MRRRTSVYVTSRNYHVPHCLRACRAQDTDYAPALQYLRARHACDIECVQFPTPCPYSYVVLLYSYTGTVVVFRTVLLLWLTCYVQTNAD